MMMTNCNRNPRVAGKKQLKQPGGSGLIADINRELQVGFLQMRLKIKAVKEYSDVADEQGLELRSGTSSLRKGDSRYHFDGVVFYFPYTATINHYSFPKPPTLGLSEILRPNPHRDNGVAEKYPVLSAQPQ